MRKSHKMENKLINLRYQVRRFDRFYEDMCLLEDRYDHIEGTAVQPQRLHLSA